MTKGRRADSGDSEENFESRFAVKGSVFTVSKIGSVCMLFSITRRRGLQVSLIYLNAAFVFAWTHVRNLCLEPHPDFQKGCSPEDTARVEMRGT